MPESHCELYYHLVWATWDRVSVIKAELSVHVYRAVTDECKALGVEVLGIGGIENNVHLVVRTPPTVSISALIKQIKGATTYFITHNIHPEQGFKWQGSYGAFTVSKRNLPDVLAYVQNQRQHHEDNHLHKEYELM